jgi:alanine racemase
MTGAQRLPFSPAEIPGPATGVLAVDLQALRANYRALAAMASPAEAAAVVKANAYGIGARKAVAALAAEGCRTFFVATLTEAAALRAHLPDAVLYVLDGLFPGIAGDFAALGVRPVLGSLPEIEEWAAFCQMQGAKFPAAIHIDTGMSRLGLDAHAVQRLASQSALLAAFEPRLIMSHLACADDPASAKNAAQHELFEALSAAFPGIPRSLANSAGIFLGSRFHFDLVRPGIALYGGRARLTGDNPMSPVVRLYGRVSQIRWAEPGETVGYGAEYTLTRRSRICTLPVGYADGYPRSVSASDKRAGAFAMTAGHRLPMLGRVSMDLTVFDATDAPEDAVQRGGFVELIGDEMGVDDLASLAGTIGYEILTSLGPRFHRVYSGGPIL